MTKQDKEFRYGPVVLECESQRESGKVYEVRCKDGTYSCNCKGWIFSKPCSATGETKQCRHTREAARLLMSLPLSSDGDERFKATLVPNGNGVRSRVLSILREAIDLKRVTDGMLRDLDEVLAPLGAAATNKPLAGAGVRRIIFD